MRTYDLDERSDADLIDELERRREEAREGRCSYCGRGPDAPACKFPERHAAAVRRSSSPRYPMEELYEQGFANLVDLQGRVSEILRQLKSGNSYVPQDIAAECLMLLDGAGLGKAGTGNTLIAMVQQAVDELRELRRAVRKGEEE